MTALWQDLREMVHEQLLYRDLLFEMAKRDFLLRYKQTFMGAAWAVFMPLTNTAVFTIIFRRVAPIDVGIPYVLYAYSGLVAWNLFASSLKFSIGSLTTNMSLVTKVYFPREIFPVSSILVCLVDFAVAHIVLGLLMFYYGVAPTSSIIYLPIVLLVHISFTAGMALLLSMCNLFYRDVKYLFDVLLMVWMFATSVLYPISLLGGRAATIMQFNPMTPIVDGYRAALLTGESPLTFAFGVAAIVAALTLGFSWIVFHRAEYRFAEIV